MTHRPVLLSTLSFVLALLVAAPATAADPQPDPTTTYRFERLWPTLQQPWYFNEPYDVAVGPQGNIYIVDSNNHRVQKLDANGVLLTKWGTYGTGDGQFDSPSAIALDARGNLYVADSNNARIQKFDADGGYLDQWGSYGAGDGQFYVPGGIAVDASGNVYVADSGNARIQKFDADGGYLNQWGSYGTGDGQFDFPKGIAVDTSGNVYVADTNNHRIQKFDANGNFILTWGSYDTGDGQFGWPEGIAVDASGNVYVADIFNHRMQKFDSNGSFLLKWGSYGTSDGEFRYPCGLAFDALDNVYVVDADDCSIQKFDANGSLILKWASSGTADGQFCGPGGIAVDASGNVYVADSGNARIQKFDANGDYLDQWGSEGTGDGQFKYLDGIAVDASGNVYVADSGSLENQRIQKFDADGNFIVKWGSYGTDEGQFLNPTGIAVGASGNLYVVDSANDRIQKFDADGGYLDQWGSYGTGDGQFDYPCGIAVDSSGNLYVVDMGNDRIQKFDASGNFLLKWGSVGTSDGQFILPHGIAVDASGNVYVADSGNARIQKFDANGDYLDQWGGPGSTAGKFHFPANVAFSPSGSIYVADAGNNRIQKFKPVTLSENSKAIIVAGMRSKVDPLWDDTQAVTNFAYRALNYQGFTKDTIYYLSSDTDLDLDDNGVADDVDADCTCANLQYALETWGPEQLNGLPTGDVVVYLTDHGGPDAFWMAPTETLEAAQLAQWLNALQAGIAGTLTVVIDSCKAGSMLDDIAAPGRIAITSVGPKPDSEWEDATFMTQGTVSFSTYFWTQIFNGLPVGEAFDAAYDAMDDYQTPMLDDTGNGIGNEPGDGTVAAATYIGNGTRQWWEGPTIGAVSAPQSIDNTATATLWAGPVTDDDGIARVWALIRPPDYGEIYPDGTVVARSSVDLGYDPGDPTHFEATHSGFTTEGTYTVYLYARDRQGNTSEPKVTTVSVTNPLSRKVLIVAGARTVNGVTLDARWPATEHNADVAYASLRSQGYGDADIEFLSHTTKTGVDGLAVLSNIDWAINTWAASDTQDLTIYLVGYGEDGAFVLKDGETLSATQLDTWLDTLQATLPGKVTVVNDTDRAATFLPLLLPPTGKQRIVIASTQTNQTAQFLVGGGISFSDYFWSSVANGDTTLWAFWHAAEAMGFAQTASIDDNADGQYIEKLQDADGAVAFTYLLGSGLVLAGSAPVIGMAAPDATLSGSPTCALWAEQVTTAGSIQAVHAVIYPPYHEGTRTMLPQSTLPTVSLTLAAGGDRRYEGTWDGFWAQGDYRVNIFAVDDEDNLSMPVTMTVHQTAGLGDGDTDGDGIPDNVEGPGDIDGDGQLNYADLDSDGDSLLDADEFHEDPDWDDLDGDGLLNCYDTDSDGDGLTDDYETATGTDPYDPDDPPATPIHLKTIALILLLLTAPLALLRLRRSIQSPRPSTPDP